MKATITKVSKVPSNKGGHFFYIFFRGEDGKSYRSCTNASLRNYKFWKPFCENPEAAVGIVCDGLKLKMDGVFNADYLEKTYCKKEEACIKSK
jgi:hypothetical protein